MPLSLISFIILKIPTLLLSSSTSARLSSIFFNRLNNPIFLGLSSLANPSVNSLSNGEYSNFACSNASGLYPKSFLVKNSYLGLVNYSYLGKSPLE